MQYAAYILDLDGVVYIGPDAVPHAIAALNAEADRGVRLAAATNNANRPAPEVARHLQELGLDINGDSVVTSAQAGAHYLRSRFAAGTEVLAVGGPGVAEALEAQGLVPLRADVDLRVGDAAARRVSAVMQGYGPGVAWPDLAAAHWAIGRGALWVATNLDSTVPTPYGRAPGNGALVQAIRHASGVEPVVVGKPQPQLFETAMTILDTRNVLVIGDRLDTDIDGAAGCGADSLMVFTGVHGFAELLGQPLRRWPSLLAGDLRSLTEEIVWIEAAGPIPVAVGRDSHHPFVGAVLDTLRGMPTSWEQDEGPTPLVDVRPWLAAAGTVSA